MKTKPKNSIKERAKKVPIIKINPRKNRKRPIPIEVKLFVQMQYDLIKEIDECIESCYCNGKIYKIEADAFRVTKIIL